MKNKYILFIVGILIFVVSCENNLLLAPGVLSFYSGSTNSNTLSMSSIKTNAVACNTEISYVYISKFEISENGTDWITLINESTEIKAQIGESTKITDTQNVPEGQYHGVRITYEPKVKITSAYSSGDDMGGGVTYSTNVVLEKMPIQFRAGKSDNEYEYWGIGDKSAPQQTVTLTTANGLLDDFDIETGKETYFIFDIRVHQLDNFTNWQLNMFVRATRFLY